MAAPPQFASLSDFTDELMQVRSGDVGHQKFIAHPLAAVLPQLSDSLKRKTEDLAARERELARREAELARREAELGAGAHVDRTHESREAYVAELEEEMATLRKRLDSTESQLAKFRRERSEVTQRLASTQSWLQDAETKAAHLSDRIRDHEKAASARTDVQRTERHQTDRRVTALHAFVSVLFDLLEGPDQRGRAPSKGPPPPQLLPPAVREDLRVFEVELPDHSGLALQAFACLPELMASQLVLDSVQMQQRCAEFMWCCVHSGTKSLPAASAHSGRRLLEVLATSMEDPEPAAEEPARHRGRSSGARRGAVWCSSRDMVVSCLSLLLVLRLSLGHGSAEGNAGVAVGDARLLSRALAIARRMLETREGKRLFLMYRGIPVVSMLLRSRNRAVRAPAATIVLMMSAEGDHLPAMFAACASEEWIRSTAIALTYAVRGVPPSRGGASAAAPASHDHDSAHAEGAEDAHVQECLCVLLQRMSTKPSYRPLFEVANLHGILLESVHSCATDESRAFFKENLSVLLHALERK